MMKRNNSALSQRRGGGGQVYPLGITNLNMVM